jgi:hypothetical protein
VPKGQALTPSQRKGKGKAKVVEVDPSTFLERVDSPWLVGAHVSAAKGVENSIINAAAIGFVSFSSLHAFNLWYSAFTAPTHSHFS